MKPATLKQLGRQRMLVIRARDTLRRAVMTAEGPGDTFLFRALGELAVFLKEADPPPPDPRLAKPLDAEGIPLDAEKGKIG